MLTSAEMYYLASAIHPGMSQAPRTLSEIQKQPPELFCEKGVLKNIAKFAGKHKCWSLFFNKVTGLWPATLLKKRL